MGLRFCPENLPILIALRDADTILKAMSPMVTNIGRAFAMTKIPSCVLEEDDYKQAGFEAVLRAIDAFNIEADENGRYDIEEYWSKFLKLCSLKVRSEVIDLQKKNYMPITVSQKVARMHPKVNQMINDGEDVSIEALVEKFGVSKKIARELLDLLKSEFSNVVIDSDRDGIVTMDIPTVNHVVDRIALAEMLEILSAEDRHLFERVSLEGEPVSKYAKDNDKQYQKVLAQHKQIVDNLRREYYGENAQKHQRTKRGSGRAGLQSGAS